MKVSISMKMVRRDEPFLKIKRRQRKWVLTKYHMSSPQHSEESCQMNIMMPISLIFLSLKRQRSKFQSHHHCLVSERNDEGTFLSMCLVLNDWTAQQKSLLVLAFSSTASVSILFSFTLLSQKQLTGSRGVQWIFVLKPKRRVKWEKMLRRHGRMQLFHYSVEFNGVSQVVLSLFPVEK